MLDPIEFSLNDQTEIWTALNADAANSALTDDDWRVFEMSKYYRALAETTGRQFPLIEYYTDHLLLSADGAKHTELRKRTATQFSKTSQEVYVARREVVTSMLDKFQTTGECDLVLDIVSPAARAVVMALCGVSTTLATSDMLAPSRSVGRLKRIEAELAIMRDFVENNFPNEDEDQKANRVTLALIGHEPLKAGLSINLMAVLNAHSGKRLCDMLWPKELNNAVLSNIIRISSPELRANGCPMKAVRIDTQVFVDDPENAQPSAIFVRGKHSCMGRGISSMIWSALVNGLSQSQRRVEVLAYEPPEHWLFNLPKKAEIRIFT